MYRRHLKIRLVLVLGMPLGNGLRRSPLGNCFASRHCCYVDSDAGEAFQQLALLLLKLPLKKRNSVKNEVIKS